MIINDLDGYYIVFDTKNWNTELDTLIIYIYKVGKVGDKNYFYNNKKNKYFYLFIIKIILITYLKVRNLRVRSIHPPVRWSLSSLPRR